MAIGIEQQPLSVADILTTQVVGFTPPTAPTLADFGMRLPSGPAP